MANAQVRIRINRGAMRAHVGKLSREAVERAAGIAENRYRTNIRTTNRVDTGEMLRGVTQRDAPGSDRMFPKIAIGTPAKQARYQEWGTRAHGPARANFMVFTPKGGSSVVFAKWVRGVTPARFARNALDSVRPTDFE